MDISLAAQRKLHELERFVLAPTYRDPAFENLRARSGTLVPGSGNVGATLCICGEGPGEQEDADRLPFVGPAGRLLWEFMQDVGQCRDGVWVTNVLKYRATDSRGKNRKPYYGEFRAAVRYLRYEIAIIQPKLVILCGKTALDAVQPGESMNRIHGRTFETPERSYLPIFHPSACLRDDSGQLTKQTRADLACVPDLLA